MPDIDLGLVKGPKGDQGAVGPTGPEGKQGATGPAGAPATINGHEAITVAATEPLQVSDDGEGTITFTMNGGATAEQVTTVKADTAAILAAVEKRPKRYGYRIKISESDPEKRVEYILDAVGMKPAKMDYEKDTFDYGDMGDLWFVARNYPVVLNRDGSEAYRLNPNDYSQTETEGDGKTRKGVTLEELTNGENVMSAIPLVWVKRYQEAGYRYVVFCESQYDDTYKAYAHTNAQGEVQPYAYHAIYEGYLDSTNAETTPASQAAIITECKNESCPKKAECTNTATAKITDAQCQSYMRSVSGVQPTSFTNTDWEMATAKRNGTGWNIKYWSLNELIADLLTFMGKNCNTQTVFGQGHTERNTNGTTPAMLMLTGTMDKKGQFWGSNTTKPTADQAPGDASGAQSHPCGVKVFHIENFWGDRWERQLGICAKNGVVLVKMTPEGSGYNATADGYTPVMESKNTASGSGYRKATVQTEYGAIPIPPCTGSATTYETDFYWWQVDATVRVSFFGGSCGNGTGCGARCWSLNDAAGHANWAVGASLTYIKSSS